GVGARGGAGRGKPQPVSADFVGPLPPSSVVPTRARFVPTVVLPADAVARSDANLDRSRPYRVVRVHRGETLDKIARREGVTVAPLMRWNGLKHASVRRNTRLRVQLPEASPSNPDMDPAAIDLDGADSPAKTELAASDASAADASSEKPRVVHVQRGDTLTEIAREHGITVDALMKANGLKSGRSLRVGQRLVIPQS